MPPATDAVLLRDDRRFGVLTSKHAPFFLGQFACMLIGYGAGIMSCPVKRMPCILGMMFLIMLAVSERVICANAGRERTKDDFSRRPSNLFAGIDLNTQVRMMSRGKMKADVKHAIEYYATKEGIGNGNET